MDIWVCFVSILLLPYSPMVMAVQCVLKCVFEKDNPCDSAARARDYSFTDMKQYYVMLCWCVHLVI